MPKAYRVLTEKYQALLEADLSYQGYEISSNDATLYVGKSYELFVKRCMEASTYEELARLCKDFYLRPIFGDRYRVMHITVVELREAAYNLISPLNLPVPEVGPYKKVFTKKREIKDIHEYLTEAIYLTILSVSRMETGYSLETAVKEQEHAKEIWNAWHHIYSSYKRAVKNLKTGSEEAGFDLDV